jgi:hypothetical protein
MSLVLHLRLSGLLLVLLGLAHAAFDTRLNWRRDIQRLTPVNRQIFLVHWFYIALALVLLGLLSLLFAVPLLQPGPLPRAIFLGTCIVWTTRLFVQWFVFDRGLWRQDPLNRAIHYLLTVIWLYLLAVNALALVRLLA